MKSIVRWSVMAAAVLLSTLPVRAQAASGCPVTFLKLDPSGVSVRIKNISGKKIVGLTIYAALADATEHWKWLHYDFDDTKPLREFGWNKEINPDAAKTLSWDRWNLDSEHGGGGAMVLTSALFSDGTTWDSAPGDASCGATWFNSHKKSFAKAIVLPPRP